METCDLPGLLLQEEKFVKKCVSFISKLYTVPKESIIVHTQPLVIGRAHGLFSFYCEVNIINKEGTRLKHGPMIGVEGDMREVVFCIGLVEGIRKAIKKEYGD